MRPSDDRAWFWLGVFAAVLLTAKLVVIMIVGYLLVTRGGY